MTNEKLLEEARRRYPKGTVYHCAHLSVNGESTCIVSDPSEFHISGNYIYESYGNATKNKHGYNECIYDAGKWAEIVSTPLLQSKPEIGRYITITDSYGDEVFITKVMGYDGEKWLNNSPILLLTDKNYYSQNNTTYTDESRTWKYSTEDEIDHLDACIIAGKYVEKPLKEVVEKESSEFLTELGDEWYSLVGYNLLNQNGNVETIIEHNESGHCTTSAGNYHDVHNIDAPYDMKWKLVKVYAKKPVTKEYTYKEGDEVSHKSYPGIKFIVRGYSEKLSKYLISSEGFDGHGGGDEIYSITWGGPVKDKRINWWAEESDLSPWVEKEEESFQIGRWYQCKTDQKLFIKPISINGISVTSNIIWTGGRYQEKQTADDVITEWNLLDDLSIIQEFLPDGHPDKVVVVEKTPEPKSFVGRYIKVLDKHAKEQYGINNGDYLLFNAKNSCGTYQLWGDLVFRHYHGINVHTNPDFELMPEGFHPDDVKHTELKVGQWVKIIDKPERGRPIHWCPDGEMDKYFGQWVQVVDADFEDYEDYEDFSFMIEDDWYLMHSDYTEVSDNKPETVRTWLDEQQEYHRRQHCQYNILMNERESMIQSHLFFTYTCESKEDTLSSHLILLDVKPVRVSKQFK